ncbi:hypothetical protein DSM112329_04702 [Paraconexibacter sp. AEG42_29]|uniref:Bacterial bifunctional deaminase-reductase C-terminal domain-containing protein n=1 Tax=Paraconexibacter sp. AEG42_29 TaxID=2997339 RepID=A0AAU7B1D3_9ACTN
MGKLLYSVSMSLDGFIAGPDGDMSWLAEHLGPNPVADDLVAAIGALLVGHRTFGGDDPNARTDKEGAFGGAWSGPQFVLTHHPRASDCADVTFLDDLDEAVTAAKTASGGKYVNVLGANVAEQCLAAGVLDEVLVFVVPTLLGDGVRLFDRPGGTNVALQRLHVTEVPSSTALWYRVPRELV